MHPNFLLNISFKIKYLDWIYPDFSTLEWIKKVSLSKTDVKTWLCSYQQRVLYTDVYSY